MRSARVIIAVTVVLVIAAAILGVHVASKLSAGGFQDPGTQSARTAAALLKPFPAAGQPDLVVVVTARTGSVDGPAVAAGGLALTSRLAHDPAVVEAASYWSLGRPPPLRSRAGTQALVIATLKGSLGQQVKSAKRLSPVLTRSNAAFTSQVTGTAEVARQVSERAQHDVERAEFITTPVTAVALLVVFGGIVAAMLPLVIGIVAVVGTLMMLRFIASVTEVSVFALNLTTALGLGLAIDYSLFIVSRYREELVKGVSNRVAVARTMQTAGRTVAFSAATVTASLLALLVFPFAYIRSFAYAGVAVVALAGTSAIIVLPAVLVLLGPRVEKGRLYQVRVAGEEPFWHRQAERVMRRPWLYAVGVTALLLVLAFPITRLNLGQIDDRVVPPSVATSRQAADQIREHFASRENAALSIYLPHVDPRRETAQLGAFARRLQRLPGVARVDAATGFYYADGSVTPPIPSSPLTRRFFDPRDPGQTWVSVVPSIEPDSTKGAQLVSDIRALHEPFHLSVAGPSADLVDSKQAIADRIPLALGIIALITFVLLFLMTGSVLVPIKALLLNLLSLTATFGAMVFIFQDGRFSGFLAYTPTGSIDTFTPLLMFCIAFGLSMDYEVFLLSRIKEEYDYDRDNRRAIAVGLGRTGKIVTAAALVLMIVFAGLATSAVVQVKLFGIGLGLAVLVDAFLIRATLVPAFMSLAGRVNWWSPRFLRRWHLRYGIWESEPIRILDRAFEQQSR